HWGGPPARDAVVRRKVLGPAGAGHRGGVAWRLCVLCGDHSGESRRIHFADECPARRIGRRQNYRELKPANVRGITSTDAGLNAGIPLPSFSAPNSSLDLDSKTHHRVL